MSDPITTAEEAADAYERLRVAIDRARTRGEGTAELARTTLSVADVEEVLHELQARRTDDVVRSEEGRTDWDYEQAARASTERAVKAESERDALQRVVALFRAAVDVEPGVAEPNKEWARRILKGENK